MGDLKLTAQKFYRVNGGATQLKGVEPDIRLPGGLGYMDIGEKESPHVMPWDEVDRVKITPARRVDLGPIAKRSGRRVAADDVFKFLDGEAKRRGKRSDQTSYSLLLSTFQSEADQRRAEVERAEALYESIVPMEVGALDGDRERLSGVALENFDKKLKGLAKDAVLQEAVRIAQELD
jgi:carboxyl-terminal processing protease